MFLDIIYAILAILFVYLIVLRIVDRPSKRYPKQ